MGWLSDSEDDPNGCAGLGVGCGVVALLSVLMAVLACTKARKWGGPIH